MKLRISNVQSRLMDIAPAVAPGEDGACGMTTFLLTPTSNVDGASGDREAACRRLEAMSKHRKVGPLWGYEPKVIVAVRKLCSCAII